MRISLLHRKEKLILTAIEIIDELGIQKLTTREIAKREEVSEATLFRHFTNKNELLIAVLDYFIQFDEDILQSTKVHNLKPMEAITYLISSYAEYYENYPAIVSIMLIFHVLHDEADLSDKIKEIQNKRTTAMQSLVEMAIKESELPIEVDPYLLAVTIQGFFRETCFNWKLSNSAFSLKERSLDTLEMLLTAIHKKVAKQILS